MSEAKQELGYIIRKSKAVPRAHAMDASGMHTRAARRAETATARYREGRPYAAIWHGLVSASAGVSGSALNRYDMLFTVVPGKTKDLIQRGKAMVFKPKAEAAAAAPAH